MERWRWDKPVIPIKTTAPKNIEVRAASRSSRSILLSVISPSTCCKRRAKNRRGENWNCGNRERYRKPEDGAEMSVCACVPRETKAPKGGGVGVGAERETRKRQATLYAFIGFLLTHPSHHIIIIITIIALNANDGMSFSVCHFRPGRTPWERSNRTGKWTGYYRQMSSPPVWHSQPGPDSNEGIVAGDVIWHPDRHVAAL